MAAFEVTRKERFSLLLLEPGEIYFEDYAVFYFPPGLPEREATKMKKKGRLKVCSRSLIFDPADSNFPVLKFPLKECIAIEHWKGSLLSRLDNRDSTILIECGSCIEMLPRGIIMPYTTRKKKEKHLFTFIFGYVDDILSQICQLNRASTLPSGDQSSMIAAIVHSRQSRVKFNPCWLEELNEEMINEQHGNRVTPLVTNPGRIMLTSSRLYFQPYNNADTFPVLKLRLDKIKRVVKRRFLLRQVGLELFCSDDCNVPYLFLSLTTSQDRDSLYNSLLDQSALQLKSDEQENMTLLWQNRVISNYDYLLYLNTMADRSFNDLAQYPVFPWVISDYHSSQLDLTNPANYRDLRKPIGALNEERLKKLKSRYAEMAEPKFLYGSHYSTPGFVLYYIVRKVPQLMLCLQSGRFDHPDRMFNCVADTWKNVTTNTSDFKELIPQFYQPENKGDFLVNAMNIDFGNCQDGVKVGDVELPPWAKGPEDFVNKMRTALESDIVSSMLHHWIDLIFGYKQQGEEAAKADNVFYYLTYEGAVDLDSIRDINDRYSTEVQIMEFGQVPRQIFTHPHPSRNCTQSNLVLQNVNAEFTETTEKESEVQSKSKQSWNNLEQIEIDTTYQLHKDTVREVCFSQDNKSLFSVSQDCLLKVYSLEEKRQQRSINISSMALSSMKLMSDAKTALIGSWDNNVYAYNFEYGTITSTILAHDDAVSDICWNAGYLITSSWDSTVKIWNYSPEIQTKRNSIEHLVVSLDHDTKVNCICVDNSNSILLSGTDDGQVHLWDLETYSLTTQFSVHTSAVYDLEISPDGKRFICCGNDLQMYDINTKSQLFHKNPGQHITRLKWDGTTVLAGGAQGSLMIWDLTNAQLRKNVSAHRGTISCLDVSNNGEIVATGGEDKKIVLWKIR